jgi:multidrug efflux pump subunit AcrB
MKKELGLALLIAIFLIFITLLTMFNSFRSTFIILSVIPFSILGAVLGHIIMDMNFAMPSVIGILGLAGVVINNGVVMLDFIRKTHTFEELLERASLRLRPIIITSVTTFVGLSTLIFFASGQAVILQPIAVSLGFGLLWGTVLNLIYLPAFFVVLNKKQFEES